MRFLNSVPGDQFTARRAATWIKSPVRMSRFVRGPRSVGRQVPKFAIETRSPDSRRAIMTSNAVRSTSRTCRSVKPCVLAATSLERLARPYMPLFPLSLKDGSFLWWNARIRHCNAVHARMSSHRCAQRRNLVQQQPVNAAISFQTRYGARERLVEHAIFSDERWRGRQSRRQPILQPHAAAQLPRAQELRMHAERLDLASGVELRGRGLADFHVKVGG